MMIAKNLIIRALVGLSLAAIAWGNNNDNIDVYAQGLDPNPPSDVIKLIFIHHSCGENWLADDHGGLGLALGENNYFVSDTNYGWGPDAIGDRTDILNWPEWFRSANSERYTTALFTESGQNSPYSRALQDPGGENRIIMFKSCFPNSNLEGSPNDPPAPGEGLTVSHAKYIYNDLLNYFATRPDKLFVVATAPPVQDPIYAANARSFNLWLVQNWLGENNYSLGNVVVYDFYNVLTHPDNHHRFNNGQIEYIASQGNNTLYYDSDGDDHPNPSGNQKATNEFIPLLNVFYNRWKVGAPIEPPVIASPQPAVTNVEPLPVATSEPSGSAASPLAGDIIDDFEGGVPPGSQGWQPFWDEGTQTTIICAPQNDVAFEGNGALYANFAVEANSWATCALIFDTVLDWKAASGLSFYVHANQPALVFDVNAYGGEPGSMTTYLYKLETTQEMVDDWVFIELSWDMLLRADWEENPGSPFYPQRVTGIALGFDTFPDAPNNGEIWIDGLRLTGIATQPVQVESPTESPPDAVEPEPTETTSPGRSGRICPGSIALGLLTSLGLVYFAGKPRFISDNFD